MKGCECWVKQLSACGLWRQEHLPTSSYCLHYWCNTQHITLQCRKGVLFCQRHLSLKNTFEYLIKNPLFAGIIFGNISKYALILTHYNCPGNLPTEVFVRANCVHMKYTMPHSREGNRLEAIHRWHNILSQILQFTYWMLYFHLIREFYSIMPSRFVLGNFVLLTLLGCDSVGLK